MENGEQFYEIKIIDQLGDVVGGSKQITSNRQTIKEVKEYCEKWGYKLSSRKLA